MSDVLRNACQRYLEGQLKDVEFLAAVQLPEAQRKMVVGLMEMPPRIHQQISYENLMGNDEGFPPVQPKQPPKPKSPEDQRRYYFQKLAKRLWPNGGNDTGERLAKYLRIFQRDPKPDSLAKTPEEDMLYDFQFTDKVAASAFREFVGQEASEQGSGWEVYRVTYGTCFALDIVPTPAVLHPQ